MSSVGEDAATGTVWKRLCAVGIVLCKLFSGDKSTLSFEDGSMLTHDECINSSKEDENEHVVKRTSPFIRNLLMTDLTCYLVH